MSAVKRARWRVLRDALRAQGGLCLLCGLPLLRRQATVEHVVPLARGGTDAAGNLAASHAACNGARRTAPLTADQEARWRGALARAGADRALRAADRWGLEVSEEALRREMDAELAAAWRR